MLLIHLKLLLNRKEKELRKESKRKHQELGCLKFNKNAVLQKLKNEKNDFYDLFIYNNQSFKEKLNRYAFNILKILIL
jgi:hypothetical protein